jgi:hypothetical protein
MGFNPIRSLENAVDTGIRTAGDAAQQAGRDFESALKVAADAGKHVPLSDLGHTVLDVASFVPGLGTVTGLVNAGWYAAEGDWGNAAFSAATAIPIAGDFVDALKVGKDVVTVGKDVEKGLKLGEEVAKAARAEESAAKIAKDGKDLVEVTEGAGKLEKGAVRRSEEGVKAENPGGKTGDGAKANKGGEEPAKKPETNAVSSPSPEGGPSGPRIHSRYADNRPVYEGQEPPRIKRPDPAAEGPHSVIRYDPINGRIYQTREFDAAGHPVRDVDFTNPTYPNGTVRPGHPGPPHQHRFFVNDPNVGPRSGFKRGGAEPMP